MNIPIYQVDAFTNQLFKGNPAAVCPLDSWLADDILLNIAKENNLAETAFCVKQGQQYEIRWFTPEIEMDLCGHATLATAHVLFHEKGYTEDQIVFISMSGKLQVAKEAGFYSMDFPSRKPVATSLPEVIAKGLNLAPKEVYKSRDYVLVYNTEEEIKRLVPNVAILNTINLDPGGIIVTAKGEKVDFVSRFFTPLASLFEDPVTGSAHCSLIPFWAERLGKNQLLAHQISERGGVLHCEYQGERVIIKGEAITFLKGTIHL